MAKVQVLNVAVLDNPSPFGNPFQFEITFECMEDLPEGTVGAHLAESLGAKKARSIVATTVCAGLLMANAALATGAN